MLFNRRDFLAACGAAYTTPLLLPSETAEAASFPSPAVNEVWDMSWVARVKGKYRAVFDSPGFSDGAGLFRASIWRRQYKEVFGTAPAEMTAVLVVRHQAIWLAMSDDFWRKYNVGKRQKFKDSEKKQWYDHNPVAVVPSGTPSEFDVNIPKFIADGNIVLACNLAFGSVISLVRQEEKLTQDEAEKSARGCLLPGVILQPSGVFAALHAQEAGCRYILAS
jgi:hypothetical protein